MTSPAHRPLAFVFALAITLALWAPTIGSRATLQPALAGQSIGMPHVVFASASPIVLM